MGEIKSDHTAHVRDLYYKKKYTMQAIANELGVGIDAVVYHMRKNGMARRTQSEASAALFEKKPLSFKEETRLTKKLSSLKTAGLMLYWAEGTKSTLNSIIDFANSDPEMIFLFCIFLRKIYAVNEKRLRVQLYCYSNQNISSLISFWSKLTKIPKKQFIKPYVRHDFREDGRKMTYGLVHIRYADKKLFLSIMGAIQRTQAELRVGGGVV